MQRILKEVQTFTLQCSSCECFTFAIEHTFCANMQLRKRSFSQWKHWISDLKCFVRSETFLKLRGMKRMPCPCILPSKVILLPHLFGKVKVIFCIASCRICEAVKNRLLNLKRWILSLSLPLLLRAATVDPGYWTIRSDRALHFILCCRWWGHTFNSNWNGWCVWFSAHRREFAFRATSCNHLIALAWILNGFYPSHT